MSGTQDDDVEEQVVDEVRAIEKLCDGSHANVVRFFRHGRVGKDSSFYFIDMEYCDTNLHDYVNGKSGVTELLDWPKASNAERIQYLIAGIMDQVLCGLVFIHGENYVHRDISPNNRESLHPGFTHFSFIFV
jgi:serine/threonine protein kinase